MINPQHPGETYRRAIDARRVSGGPCTILVRRVEDRVELLFHAVLDTGASLCQEDAAKVAEALRQAAR